MDSKVDNKYVHIHIFNDLPVEVFGEVKRREKDNKNFRMFLHCDDKNNLTVSNYRNHLRG